MWRTLLKTARGAYPPFAALEPSHLPRSLINSLNTPIHYTPKIQKIPFTVQLHKFIRYLLRKRTLTHQDFKTLVENIILEYGAVHHPIQGLTQQFRIQRDHLIKQTELCPYWGHTTWMIQLSHKSFVPIFFSPQKIDKVAGAALAYANMGMKTCMNPSEKPEGFSIATTGQQWQLFKLDHRMHLEKTVIYEGRNKLRDILKDQEMLCVILGLIDFSLDLPREDQHVLNLAYECIDDMKYLEERNPEEEQKKIPLMSRLLTQFYKSKLKR